MPAQVNIDPPLAAVLNMQNDRENFEKAHDFSPQDYLIRIYEWNAPSISLGISQDPGAVRKIIPDIEIVQRITGGRAVLHDNEITYSIAASVYSLFFGGSLYDTYKKISSVLEAFFLRIGVPAAVQRQKKHSAVPGRSQVCFASPSLYEITTPLGKIAGSAQKRDAQAFLQHGSIPVHTTQSKCRELFMEKNSPDTDYCAIADFLKNPDIIQLKNILADEFQKFIDRH
ncbi:MAG: hypothetical protein A2096_17940 [Spirochaetes bacterium GWF1_41_5]|nr:MAG: hypothetical protein A2096_17940 [Spirochaetes bacterium GWF1_41_5]HBE03738.1 hypothetical protein [Spirochaetia bacterium]